MTSLEIESAEMAMPVGAEFPWEESVPRGEPLQNDWKIDQTIAFMLRHLNRPLQVAEMAALTNLSPSHYFALFKRRVGCAPMSFFIRLRMRHACRLLDTTSLNIKEVAAALGYDDPFYFSRVFKSVYRVAPSEYRAMMAQKHRLGGDNGAGGLGKDRIAEVVAA